MTDNKRLAFSIIQFLHDQLQSGTLSSDAQESLEVAVQCLETAFEVSTDDQSLAVPMTLPEIFTSATAKYSAQSQVNNNSTPNSPTEEQKAEAERLKSDGNDQMKVDNFAAAVEFYSKAIAINPQNAVYYCNRAAAYSKLGNYAGAVQDCERAISIDPNYSKAYGRMGLALASLNKHTEAVSYYKKALELDPDNDTYKTNLKIAEEKMDTSSPTAGLGGVDLAGLLSNPGFMNMVRSECLACNISKRSRSFGGHQNQLHSSELTANFLVSVSFKSPFLLHRTIVQMMRPHSKSLPLIYKSTKSCDFRNYFDNKQASEG
uniref:Small glutamine-rich tetratricopeptide repeat-containing protein alpha n=1 Tax=Astatotilapia calliptera TaxID=8154 RepID=A0AAX7UU71_ASTCA